MLKIRWEGNYTELPEIQGVKVYPKVKFLKNECEEQKVGEGINSPSSHLPKLGV